MDATIPCTVCRAPLHIWEYPAHLKACIIIDIHTGVVVSAAAVHYQDQQLAWRRNKANGTWVPGRDPRA